MRWEKSLLSRIVIKNCCSFLVLLGLVHEIQALQKQCLLSLYVKPILHKFNETIYIENVFINDLHIICSAKTFQRNTIENVYVCCFRRPRITPCIDEFSVSTTLNLITNVENCEIWAEKETFLCIISRMSQTHIVPHKHNLKWK